MIRMGKNSKTENSDAQGYQPASPSPSPSSTYSDTPNTVSRPATDSENIARDIKDGKLSGFVGHGTSLTGDTNFQMMLRVDGHLTGTVSSDGGTLIVGNNGQLDANVSVGIANINGEINGDVTATEKIHLGRTGRVVGNISTPKLVIEEGAIFEGGCTMLKAREEQEKLTSAAASGSSGSSYSASGTSGSSYSSGSTSSATSSSSSSGSSSGLSGSSYTTSSKKDDGDKSSVSDSDKKSETAKI